MIHIECLLKPCLKKDLLYKFFHLNIVPPAIKQCNYQNVFFLCKFVKNSFNFKTRCNKWKCINLFWMSALTEILLSLSPVSIKEEIFQLLIRKNVGILYKAKFTIKIYRRKKVKDSQHLMRHVLLVSSHQSVKKIKLQIHKRNI